MDAGSAEGEGTKRFFVAWVQNTEKRKDFPTIEAAHDGQRAAGEADVLPITGSVQAEAGSWG